MTRLEETRTEDDVGFARQDRLQQARDVARIVFQVGVLDQHDVAPSMLEAATQCCPFSLVLRLKKQPQLRYVRQQRQLLLGPIRAAVVDDQDLLWHVQRQQPSHHLANGRPLVVHRDDDRKTKVRRILPGRHLVVVTVDGIELRCQLLQFTQLLGDPLGDLGLRRRIDRWGTAHRHRSGGESAAKVMDSDVSCEVFSVMMTRRIGREGGIRRVCAGQLDWRAGLRCSRPGHDARLGG